METQRISKLIIGVIVILLGIAGITYLILNKDTNSLFKKINGCYTVATAGDDYGKAKLCINNKDAELTYVGYDEEVLVSNFSVAYNDDNYEMTVNGTKFFDCSLKETSNIYCKSNTIYFNTQEWQKQ